MFGQFTFIEIKKIINKKTCPIYLWLIQLESFYPAIVYS